MPAMGYRKAQRGGSCQRFQLSVLAAQTFPLSGVHFMRLSTKFRYAIYAAIFMGAATPAQAKADAAHGQTLYQTRCAACHSLEYNGVGPAHQGLLGRKAGTAPGYNYSNALKASSVIWTQATLSRWLANPEKFIPGQKMGISVPDAKERADLVAYLVGATAATAKKGP
ncbi:MAG TPA: c-type cytochrome [Usitatibacteraceae bacterium]